MLSIDAESLQPLWEQANQQFGWAFPIFAIGGGITIAFLIAKGLIGIIRSALESSFGKPRGFFGEM